MGYTKELGLQERKKQLTLAINDFKKIEDFSKKVIKQYEIQLKEVETELDKIKQKEREFKKQFSPNQLENKEVLK